MKKLLLVMALVTTVSFGVLWRGGRTVQSAGNESAPKTSAPQLSTAKLPMRFEANQGQTDRQVKFLARGPGYSLFLTATGAVLRVQTPRCVAPETCQPIESVLRMNLVGAQTPAQIVGRGELAGKSNYFISNDPNQWRANVPNYEQVEYQHIYPGEGIGSFKRAVSTPITEFPSSLVTADFNGDGSLDTGYFTIRYLDGVLTKSQLILRLNDGTGKFAASPSTIDLSLTNTPLTLAVADFNGDAKLDAVMTNLRPTDPSETGVPTPLLFYPGDGAGKLGKEVSLGEIGDGLRLLPDDLNGDGRADLVSFNPERYTFSTHLNRCASGNGLFIAGRVTNQGLPTGSSGQVVKLTGSKTATTTTDSQGNYEFSGLTAGGNYTVVVERSNVEFMPSSKNFANLTSDQVANFAGQRVAVLVSAANYSRGEQAGDSLVSLFGTELSEQTEVATSLPLPTQLGGVYVTVNFQ